jgi:hypothetical protein
MDAGLRVEIFIYPDCRLITDYLHCVLVEINVGTCVVDVCLTGISIPNMVDATDNESSTRERTNDLIGDGMP